MVAAKKESKKSVKKVPAPRKLGTGKRLAGSTVPQLQEKLRARVANIALEPHVLFPVVGIGASAGGLEAFTTLLKSLKSNTGMAFVFIQHLAPDHASLLPEILQRSTKMPVVQATEGMAVEANRVFVIPPNVSMGILRVSCC